jgi:hypothetical protein
MRMEVFFMHEKDLRDPATIDANEEPNSIRWRGLNMVYITKI